MSVFDDLVGQPHVIAVLRAAARGVGMTHAWLFTGPPGSGRSIAARAFAAALQCTADRAGSDAVGMADGDSAVGMADGDSAVGMADGDGVVGTADGDAEPGCGRCAGCHTVLAGTHADVEFVRPQGLSLGVREARELVARAALAPSGGGWQVIVVEDADRLTEGAANVLLKAIEEPAARTVWLLCVPAAQDLVVTIRSRCRLVTLRTPATDEVAAVLVARDGVEPAVASFAAQVAAGHVGRARRLAVDAAARDRRRAVLDIPASLRDVPACLEAASRLVAAAEAEASELTSVLDETEVVALKEAFGEGGTATGAGRGASAVTRGAARAASSALKELEARQKSRATRAGRDALDRALVDLAGFYRDVLVVQFGAGVPIANVDMSPSVSALAAASTPESTLRRLDAIMACRTALDANANPLLAFESLMLSLRG